MIIAFIYKQELTMKWWITNGSKVHEALFLNLGVSRVVWGLIKTSWTWKSLVSRPFPYSFFLLSSSNDLKQNIFDQGPTLWNSMKREASWPIGPHQHKIHMLESLMMAVDLSCISHTWVWIMIQIEQNEWTLVILIHTIALPNIYISISYLFLNHIQMLS